ncbi:MAG: PQQ-dependent sugar dehydrogenase [Dehalococcoidia bacterium]
MLFTALVVSSAMFLTFVASGEGPVSGHGPGQDGASIPLQPTVVSPTPNAAAPGTNSETPLPKGFQETVFVDGLERPTAMAMAPDGRMFVAEQGGTLRIVEDSELLPEPFLEVPVTTEGERGLVGLVLDPDFEDNGHLYIYYTESGQEDESGNSKISRFTASDDDQNVAEEGSELVLMELPNFQFHNGGGMRFGPDRMLHFGIGDNNERSTPQDLGEITGKLHRIDPANPSDIVPDDNPFVDDPEARPETWAYGLRNPFTFAIDPETGRILVNDVGDDGWEEINEIEKGNNYGWPVCEGPFILESDESCDNPEFTDPLFAYPHEGNAEFTGCSIIGGGFYRGGQFPEEYQGNYFFSDHCGQWVARLDTDDQPHMFANFTGPNRYLSSLIIAQDGAIYFNSMLEGSIYRIEYTGLIAEASASITKGDSPLDVEFTATDSEAPDGQQLSYEWDFGDGATATGESVTHTYNEDGYYEAALTAFTNDGATSTDIVDVSVGEPPSIEIMRPDTAGPFRAGITVEFTGVASDAAGDPLPPSAFSWRLALHDGEDEEFIGAPVPGTDRVAFTIPGRDDLSDDAFYRVVLTASLPNGLTNTNSYDLRPQTTNVTFQTEPEGLVLNINGREGRPPSPRNITSGTELRVHAPSPQRMDGAFYAFDGWSSEAGGTDQGIFTAPDADTTLVATFTEVESPAGSGDSELVYDDELQWESSNWDTEASDAESPVFEGSTSLAITYQESWAGWRARTDNLYTSPYTHLQFAVSPGDLGLPKADAAFYDQSGDKLATADIREYASDIGDGWYIVQIPLADLDATGTVITGLVLQEDAGTPQPTFYLDAMALVSLSEEEAGPPPAESAEPAGLAPLSSEASGDLEEVTIEISAEDMEFSQDEITVPAGARVTVEFTNEDSAGHNVAFYHTENAQDPIFVGDIISGPETTTYTFTAPSEPGTYHFQCDPHATTMTGVFTVE